MQKKELRRIKRKFNRAKEMLQSEKTLKLRKLPKKDTFGMNS